MSFYAPTLGGKRSYNARHQAHQTRYGDPLKMALRDDGPAVKTCRYIHNDDPKNPDWCGAPVQEGSSYCPEHNDLCHERVKEESGFKGPVAFGFGRAG